MRRSPLSRRTVLRGLGALVALPLLEAMIPSRGARATGTAPPRRLVFLHVPNGIMPQHFVPEGEGSAWVPSRVLAPLVPWRDDLLVVSGMQNVSNLGGDGHGLLMGGMLTGEKIRDGIVRGVHNGQSIDQLLADRLRGATPYASLELTSEAPVACGDGERCGYLHHMSYRDKDTAVPREQDPRALFDRLFKGVVGASDPAVALRRRRDLLVVDAIAEDAGQLRSTLGRTDQGVLDGYLESLFELERQLDGAPTNASCGADVARLLPSDRLMPPYTVEQHAHLMTDLVALALRCDLTRVASWQLANELTRRVYTNLGIVEQHHRASHHLGDPSDIELLGQICTWEMGLVAHFVGRLAELKEVDGSRLLDHTAVVAFAVMSDPDPHDFHELPIVVAGQMGGVVRTGRHLRQEGRPVAELWMGLAAGMGVELETFGEAGTVGVELG